MQVWKVSIAMLFTVLTLVLWLVWLNYRLTQVESSGIEICKELAIVANEDPLWDRLTICEELEIINPEDVFPQSDESQ